MKRIRKFVLPVVLLTIGVGSAFATNLNKKSSKIVVQGYRFDPLATGVKCIPTDVECKTEDGPACTWNDGSNSHILYQYINDTMCGQQLSKIE